MLRPAEHRGSGVVLSGLSVGAVLAGMAGDNRGTGTTTALTLGSLAGAVYGSIVVTLPSRSMTVR